MSKSDEYYNQWKLKTKAIYSQYIDFKEIRKVRILGKEFLVLPQVFSPEYHANTKYFAEQIPKIVGPKHVLEIGTGTGVIAIFCALNGAQVTATDINISAVKNCKLNTDKHKVVVDVRYGDLFEPLGENERFDFIFWNHPWNYTDEPETNVLLQAGFDYKYENLRKFFQKAKNHLTEDGRILVGTGSFARLDMLDKFAKEEGYEGSMMHREKHTLGVGKSDETEFLIYSFTRT